MPLNLFKYKVFKLGVGCMDGTTVVGNGTDIQEAWNEMEAALIVLQ